MTVTDYILAGIGVLAALIWCGWTGRLSLYSELAPNPDAATDRTSFRGCMGLLAGLLALAWLAGVLWNGEWGWLG